MNLYRYQKAVILFCFSLFACNTFVPPVQIPATVLPKDSMVSLLVDLHLLEAAIDQGMIKGAGNSLHADTYYRIFEFHHSRRAVYDSSMVFYSSHPDMLANIYEKVIVELNRKQIGLK